jgi:hypothetical protein
MVKKWMRYSNRCATRSQQPSTFTTIGVRAQVLTAVKKMDYTWVRKEGYAPNAAVDLTAAGFLLSKEEQ